MKKMEKFDWSRAVRSNFSAMTLAGLWPSGDETYKQNLYTLYASVLITLLLLFNVFFQTMYLFFVLNDLQALTGSVLILLSEMLIVLKAYCLTKNMGMVKQLMKTLNSDLFQPKTIEQIVLVKPSLKFCKRTYQTLSVMTSGTVVFWSIFPIMDNSFKDYRLPFFAWYPYNTKISPFYEMTYVYQILCTAFTGLTSVCVDTLIASLNMYIATQFDLLCDDLRNLCDPDEAHISRQLIACIQHHKAILSFAANSNEFFNSIIFLQFFVSAISMGLTMFQLTVIDVFSNEFYSLVFYLNAVLVEIFMYCWFGNEVEIKSSKISYAIFECDWIRMSQKTKRAMIFFVLKCQKPLKISAFNLFFLSLETFVKILKTGWSYFALLHQINSRN